MSLMFAMSGEPTAIDGFVSVPTDDAEPVLKDPGVAEAYALNILAAASEARAHRLAKEREDADPEEVDEARRAEGKAKRHLERVEANPEALISESGEA